MKLLLASYILGTLLVPAQAEDWKLFFDQSQSTDAAVRDAARDRGSAMLKRLLTLNAEALNAELEQMLPFLRDPREAVRIQASGLVPAFTMFRDDGVVAFRSVIPILLEDFSDKNPAIRENAVYGIVTLRPAPPPAALVPLTKLLDEQSPRAVGSATLGLMRMSVSQPAAEQLVRDFLNREKRPDRIVAAIYNIGEAGRADAATITLVSTFLGYSDDRVGMASILTLEKVGTTGMTGALARIAADPEMAADIRTRARQAADKLSRRK